MSPNFYNTHMTIAELSIYLKIKPESIYTNIINHEDSARYLVEYDGRTYINTIEYKKQFDITYRSWMYNTDSLYWLMRELFNKEMDIARYMAEKSLKYKSINSWSMFLSKSLFAIQHKKGSSVKLSLTQHSEFTRISSEYIYKLIKEGYFNDVYKSSSRKKLS